MVTLTAREGFRLTDLNFAEIFQMPIMRLRDDADEMHRGQTYEDTLLFKVPNGPKVVFRGSGIEISEDARPSGRIEAITGYSEDGTMSFALEGISLSLGKLDRLADTYTFRDDGTFLSEKFAGNDTFHLSSGDDYVVGFDGDDTIHGRGGIDQIMGGIGQDVLRGGAGSDVLEGGDDDDDVRGGSGDDLIHGDNGDDLLRGHYGDDLLRGGSGADDLGGGDGHDHLEGGWGDDTLRGGDGYDVLIGGWGDDTLNGGTGYNKLTGGEGEDVFVFKDKWQRSEITDFDPTEDILKLRVSGVDGVDDLAVEADGTDLIISYGAGREFVVSGFGVSEVIDSWFDFG